MMDKNEIIERLGEIAKHAVHTIGEEPFIMSLDDGIAVHEAIEIIQQSQPEREKGKWNFIGDNMFECTYCGVVYTTQQLNGLRNYNVDPYTPKFCPNCGAPMVSEEAM